MKYLDIKGSIIKLYIIFCSSFEPSGFYQRHTHAMSTTPEEMEEEFKEIQLISNSTMKPCEAAITETNKPKNRYDNVLPFDETRVKLEGHPDFYINASVIQYPETQKTWIATQGPLPCTFSSFWMMIFHMNVETIFMLTKFIELKSWTMIRKCHEYWPIEAKDDYYGDIHVTLVHSDKTIRNLEINTFELERDGETKTVIQYFYTGWPDQGTPDKNDPAFQCVLERLLNETGLSCVHCSAGVGRTGTLIAIDIMSKTGHSPKQVVSTLREQRCLMVQTKEQYKFLFEFQ